MCSIIVETKRFLFIAVTELIYFMAYPCWDGLLQLHHLPIVGITASRQFLFFPFGMPREITCTNISHDSNSAAGIAKKGNKRKVIISCKTNANTMSAVDLASELIV